ncbi:TPA: fimbrial protein [Klebsiella quasipneumoniae subsp. quasipneumoniae]|nr:fimbrial protein [Klebsiella quasipneumoniae subsp. quasipneumoniae]HBR2082105.1 fimbrial protein [Klebsiella quasipneumoniae subsp. quasipneumoniae]
MRLFRSALLMLAVLFPLSGFCCDYTYIGSSYTVDYGNIIVQRDVPVGQAISNEIYGSLAHAYTCVTTGNEGSSSGMKSAILPYVATYGARRVYQTNVPGVGISFGFYMNSKAGASTFSGTDYIDRGNASMSSWSSNPGELVIHDYQPVIQFWKIGDITSGSVTGQLASFVAFTMQYLGGEQAPEIPVNAGAGSITQVACAVTTSNMVFELGDVLVSEFGSAVGSTPANAQKTQNLILDCDAGANINVMLSGAQNPDVSDNTVLALTGQGSAGVAQGVGVQLVYNNTPLILGNNLVLKRTNGGQEMFPLTARYYQTNTTVTTGIANASATLSLTYQ